MQLRKKQPSTSIPSQWRVGDAGTRSTRGKQGFVASLAAAFSCAAFLIVVIIWLRRSSPATTAPTPSATTVPPTTDPFRSQASLLTSRSPPQGSPVTAQPTAAATTASPSRLKPALPAIITTAPTSNNDVSAEDDIAALRSSRVLIYTSQRMVNNDGTVSLHQVTRWHVKHLLSMIDEVSLRYASVLNADTPRTQMVEHKSSDGIDRNAVSKAFQKLKEGNQQWEDERRDTSARRYRSGSIGALMGHRGTALFDSLEARSKLCVERGQLYRHPDEVPDRSHNAASHNDELAIGRALGMPHSSLNVSVDRFTSLASQQWEDRIQRCFRDNERPRKYLLANVVTSGDETVFEQLEQVMSLLALGLASSRTVVIPSLRIVEGRGVLAELSHVFDTRMLFSANSGVCILEEDEFVELESMRLDKLRGEQQSKDATMNTLWPRLVDTLCLRVADGGHRDRLEFDGHCEERKTIAFPYSFDGGEQQVDLFEDAVDEALKVTTSFHRVVHIGPLMLQMLGPLVGKLVETRRLVDSLNGNATLASSTAEHYDCLWRMLRPHPFLRRGVQLVDVLLEEHFPTPRGRNKTWEARRNHSEQPTSASATETVKVNTSEPRPPRTLFRPDTFAVEIQPLISGGIRQPCQVMLLPQPVALMPNTSSSMYREIERLKRWETSCHISQVNSSQIIAAPHNDGALALLLASTTEGEALDSLQLTTLHLQHQRQQLSDDGDHRRPWDVYPLYNSERRVNRLTKFVSLVTDHKQVFLGGSNAFLIGGHSPSRDVAAPYRLVNPFLKADAGFFFDLLHFWILVESDGSGVRNSKGESESHLTFGAPWSALSRTACAKRRADRRTITQCRL